MQNQYMTHLHALYELSTRLASVQMTDDIGQMVIELLERTVGYAYGAVLLIEQPSGRLVPIALSPQGRDQAFVESDKAYIAAHNLTVGTGITGWVARTGQTVRLADARQDVRYYAMRKDIQAELCVPLRVGRQVLGVINTETTYYNAYTAADQRLLETVANHLAFVAHYHQSGQQTQATAAKVLPTGEAGIERESPARRAAESERSWRELEAAFATTRQLQGLLVICAGCKQIRDADGIWQPIAWYFEQHPYVTYSHGLCPACLERLYPEDL
jgi:GAF domain-containing protein